MQSVVPLTTVWDWFVSYVLVLVFCVFGDHYTNRDCTDFVFRNIDFSQSCCCNSFHTSQKAFHKILKPNVDILVFSLLFKRTGSWHRTRIGLASSFHSSSFQKVLDGVEVRTTPKLIKLCLYHLCFVHWGTAMTPEISPVPWPLLQQTSQSDDVLRASAKPRVAHLTLKEKSTICPSIKHVPTALLSSVGVLRNSSAVFVPVEDWNSSALESTRCP